QSCSLETPKPVCSDVAVTRRGRDMNRRRRRRNQLFELAAARLERLVPKIAIAQAQQIKKHERSWSLLRQELHARSGGMQPQLQKIEIELIILDNDNFAVEHAPQGQCRKQR